MTDANDGTFLSNFNGAYRKLRSGRAEIADADLRWGPVNSTQQRVKEWQEERSS